MWGHPGSVLPFTEQKQRRFLRDLGLFICQMSTGFNLKSTVAIAPNKRVSLSFEARHWLLSSYERPGWHLQIFLKIDILMIKKKRFIYFDVLDLRCSTWNLHCGTWDLLVALCKNFSCNIWTLSCSMQNLVPWPGIKPGPPALGTWNLSHWTTREVLSFSGYRMFCLHWKSIQYTHLH